MKKTITAIAALALLTAGCTDSATERFNDAPVQGNLDTPAIRISFPDGYGNAAVKCVGPDLLASNFNGDGGGRALAFAQGHPWCVDGIVTQPEAGR